MYFERYGKACKIEGNVNKMISPWEKTGTKAVLL